MSALHPMLVKAARTLCDRGADQCGVDREDSWKTYGDDYLKDAEAVLSACGAFDLLQAMESIRDCCEEDRAARDYESRQTEIRGIARAAIAKAEGRQ